MDDLPNPSEKWDCYKASLHVGQDIAGFVQAVVPYGFFVDLGGDYLGLVDVGSFPLPRNQECWPIKGDVVMCKVLGFRNTNRQVVLGWITKKTALLET